MKIAQALGAIGILVASLLTTQPAQATDQFDLSVALKVLPLLSNKMTSPVPVAVIYDPTIPESKTDAETIKAIIDGGLEAPGDLKLNLSLISTKGELGLSAFKIAFLAHGLTLADDDVVSAQASAAGVLTFCTDIDDVKANKCVLGVASRPRVSVYYSPMAAENARISFAPVFTLLVKQVGSM